MDKLKNKRLTANTTSQQFKQQKKKIHKSWARNEPHTHGSTAKQTNKQKQPQTGLLLRVRTLGNEFRPFECSALLHLWYLKL